MWPIAIVGHYKPGWEDADTIAARLSGIFERLEGLDVMFSRWRRIGARRHSSGVPAFVTIPPDRTELRSWIEEGLIVGSREGRKKTIGYAIGARTPNENPLCADFRLSFEPEGWWFVHRIGITIFSGSGFPSVLDDAGNHVALIALLHRVLLITATAWDCDWAGVSPGDYLRSQRSPKTLLVKYQSGWMVYLDAARASHIIPPEDVAVERLADGAMLLTGAADAIFNGHNPNHRAAAQRIQTALEPLNAEKEHPNG